jgi:hypothetical protein
MRAFAKILLPGALVALAMTSSACVSSNAAGSEDDDSDQAQTQSLTVIASDAYLVPSTGEPASHVGVDVLYREILPGNRLYLPFAGLEQPPSYANAILKLEAEAASGLVISGASSIEIDEQDMVGCGFFEQRGHAATLVPTTGGFTVDVTDSLITPDNADLTMLTWGLVIEISGTLTLTNLPRVTFSG